MKLTKKEKKKLLGMNSATKVALKKGHKQPIFRELMDMNNMPTGDFVKIAIGVPYVNLSNFQA
jgi:hypothetical protein